MRWVTYDAGGDDRVGLIVDEQIHGLARDVRLLDLLGDDGERMAAAADNARQRPTDVRPLAGASLRAPLQPPSIRDFLCFLDHLRNCRAAANIPMDKEWEEIPAFYFSNVAAVVGPRDPVPISPGSSMFDFELEVAAVIGKAGSDLDPATAADHIAGYMIFCDWSARDLQMHEMKLSLGPSKGKDGANTLGPALVTADELAPFASGPSFHLEMQAWVNDEKVGHGFMDQMDWSFGEIVAYASRGTRLTPGDVIGTGTVPTGCLFEHFATNPDGFRGWLAPGDRVRLTVDQLGEIEHEILPSVPVHPLHTGF